MTGGDQERNLAVVSAWIEAYNAQDFPALAGLVGKSFRVDDPATGNHIEGWDAFEETARQVARTYPDRRITVLQMLPLGDSAVALQGEWDSAAAGAHHIESMVVELVDGKIASRRIYR